MKKFLNYKYWSLLGLASLMVGGIVACKKHSTHDFLISQYDPTPYSIPFANNTLPPLAIPADNPLTVAKVLLGRTLFYDKTLSLDNSISCATCHNQRNNFSDENTFSKGVGGALGNRQSMVITNLAYNTHGFFWDGRVNLLRHQAVEPIKNPVEMKETLDHVIKKLSFNFQTRNLFIRAFGSDEITEERISFALEAFMTTLISDDSKYDRYLAGKETFTASELRGRDLFFTEFNEFFPDESGADCFHCHGTNKLQMNLFSNNGLDFESEFTDLGRELVTGLAENRAQFKVPTLRNIEVSGPYMHDGRFKTLEEVIDHYNEGVKMSSTLDGAMAATTTTGLMLDQQDKTDLINFLKTLTDQRFLTNPAFGPPRK